MPPTVLLMTVSPAPPTTRAEYCWSMMPLSVRVPAVAPTPNCPPEATAAVIVPVYDVLPAWPTKAPAWPAAPCR